MIHKAISPSNRPDPPSQAALAGSDLMMMMMLNTRTIDHDDDVKHSNDNFMKKVNCKHADHKAFRTRDENLNCATSIEKKSIH